MEKTKEIVKTKSAYALARAGVGGQPQLWKTPEELELKIEEYKQHCLKREEPYTMGMLAVFLGCDRKTLVNYSKKDEFFHTIKRVRQMVEASVEVGLLTSPRTVGHIFNLKNNHGWVDKHELEMSGSVGINGLVTELESRTSGISAIEGELAEDEQTMLE